ncbi:MAG: crosslink repair DNA glycosylase YcaQ family protein, partial [Acidaminobacteraceae bacterium]
SESFLGVKNLKSAIRNKAFLDLYKEGITEKISVEGIKFDFYIEKSNIDLIDYLDKNYSKRVSFIAPLDNLMWDRKLIKALFDFEYKWEVYTPKKDRKYGYYVLPVLFGDRFIGRIEPVFEKKTKTLHFRGLWLDEYPNKAFKIAVIEFAEFLGATSISYGNKTKESLEWLESLMKRDII